MPCLVCQQEHAVEPLPPMEWQTPIPAILHHVWTTDTTPSPLLKACRESFLGKHPQWSSVLHRSPNGLFEHPSVEHLYPRLGEAYERYGKLKDGPLKDAPWAAQADLLRLAALYVFGGFYVDYDLYCRKPLDAFRNDDLVLVNCQDEPLLVTEAVIGCRPLDPRIHAILEEFSRCKVLNGVVTPRITCFVHQWGIKTYPSEYFIPHARGAADVYRVTDNTHAIHCWKQNHYDLERLEKI